MSIDRIQKYIRRLVVFFHHVIYPYYHDLILIWRELIWLFRDVISKTEKENLALVNKRYVREYLNFDSMWASDHGSDEKEYLGAGMLYYSLAYMKRAKLCVCLGSGGGFIPRMMAQAQRDLDLNGAETILVDANIGSYGRPYWIKKIPIPPKSFFLRKFPEIKVIMETTSLAAERNKNSWEIDYLHIDADHSYEGSLQDFYNYKELMSPDGIITFHDTKGTLDCWRTIETIKEEGHEVVNFPDIGAGVALINIKGK